MLYFHYPKNLIVNETPVFCNMRLIDNQILLPGAVYLNSPIEYKNIRYFVNNVETKFEIIEKRSYEPSIICIAINDDWVNLSEVCLKIFYNNVLYTFTLAKEIFTKCKITAMTLFKNDFELLDLYIDYHSKMGIEKFFLYYNDILDQEKFKFLEGLDVEIHITEWNYKYWVHPIHLGHHAQVMALADGLNVIKHFSEWCLFNDLDEYIFLEGFDNFNDLVSKNPNINHFDFLAYWSKIGNEVIHYKDAYQRFKKEQIIKSTKHCGNAHHKSLVKVDNVIIQGVHFPICKHQSSMTLSGIYHFCNFHEQERSHYCKT